MMQHYDLGQWLRRRYITEQNFLNKTYVRTEMKVISTDFDRTIMSADANIQGLYPRDKEIGDGVLWKPIPVFRIPYEYDTVGSQFQLKSVHPCQWQCQKGGSGHLPPKMSSPPKGEKYFDVQTAKCSKLMTS